MSIFNGETLRTLDEVIQGHFERLEKILGAIQAQEPESELYARRKSMVALDGTGAGTITWQVPLGYDWILQRVTVTSTGNGTVQFFIGTTSLSDLVEQVGSSALYSDAFANNIFVPEGNTLYAVFAGAGANGQATVNLQIKTVRHRQHKDTMQINPSDYPWGEA